MHRWDLEAPVGRHAPIDAETAADGIDELLTVYTARCGPHELTEPLTIRCRGRETAWLITPTNVDGKVRVTRVSGADSVDVEGDPVDLMLLLRRRLDLDSADLRVSTRRDKLTKFLAGPITA